jgi:hypothetical protein
VVLRGRYGPAFMVLAWLGLALLLAVAIGLAFWLATIIPN